jgi:pSer/pThr/pTyr-binding forkhead associated (FHA) protein
MTDCWLVLDDDLVSRYHAQFELLEEGLTVEDLGSRNGTYVNGERLAGKATIRDGDQVRIGREVIAVIGPAALDAPAEDDDLRRTIGPGEETQFPTLISQLVEKSLKVGKLKDAERYAVALANQLMVAKAAADHPTSRTAVRTFIALGEKTSSGLWLAGVARNPAPHGWVMDGETLGLVRKALDRVARVPGSGLESYEQTLRAMQREGQVVPADLLRTVAEWVDAFGGG